MGLAIAFTADRTQIALSIPMVAIAFLLSGEGKLLIKMFLTMVPLLGLAALLWGFVNISDSSSVFSVASALFLSDSRFMALARALTASLVFVLAFGTIGDGKLYDTLFRMGLPSRFTTVFASAYAVAITVQESFLECFMALRAQGVIGPSLWSKLTSVGTAVAVTWVASLSTVVGRSENKWARNNFLGDLQVLDRTVTDSSVRHTFTFFVTSALLLLVLTLRAL